MKPMRSTLPFHLDVVVRERDADLQLRRDAWLGFRRRPKEIRSRWFYDQRGSALFDAITRLPEYYLTRKETEILQGRALQVASAAKADTLVDLGAGTGERSRLLLDAMRRAKTLERYIPVDLAATQVIATGESVAQDYDIEVHAIIADFERHLSAIPQDGTSLYAMLGSTLGDLKHAARARFLEHLAGQMRPGDRLVLGLDLVKERETLEAAYNDSAGITASFNKHMLVVLNRRLRANFDLRWFEHVARWDPEHEWIEMLLRSKLDQRVFARDIRLEARFEAGEEVRTEINVKFRRPAIEEELGAVGLQPANWYTDQDEQYAVMTAVR